MLKKNVLDKSSYSVGKKVTVIIRKKENGVMKVKKGSQGTVYQVYDYFIVVKFMISPRFQRPFYLKSYYFEDLELEGGQDH